MRVVNFFAGWSTWLHPFQDLGHETWATDIVRRPGINLAADMLDIELETIPEDFQHPDVVLASPDCRAFSISSASTHWLLAETGPIAKTELARVSMRLVEKLRSLIDSMQPKFFVIENPRGMLRKLGLMNGLERRTVWYCHYFDERAKPTDLWGGFPSSLVLRPPCHNRVKSHPIQCCCNDHDHAPRHSERGTSARLKRARAFIPYDLAMDVCLAVERDLEDG